MELKVYWSEHFDKNIWWYIIFFAIIAIVFFLAVYLWEAKTRMDYLALAFAGLIVAGYFYFNKQNQTPIIMKVDENWLTVRKKTISWLSIQWYVLEMDKKTREIKNIVILYNKWHQIHTIIDSLDNLENFAEEFEKYKPRFEEYEQSFFERFGRMCRL